MMYINIEIVEKKVVHNLKWMLDKSYYLRMNNGYDYVNYDNEENNLNEYDFSRFNTHVEKDLNIGLLS